MNLSETKRIESVDLLKGLVMVIMALDHTRDYFHWSSFFYDPTNPVQSTLPIFFTRWITHFCAPTFCFLAGLSAFLYGKKKSKSDLTHFLWKRGLWLVFIELTIVNFAWYFDMQFRTPTMQVIWSLGISMIFLSALIHLPKTGILIFSCVLIFGHNLLDSIHFPGNILWSILHEFSGFSITENINGYIAYPIIPWVGVMSLGFWFGSFYDYSYDSSKRKKIFNSIGFSSLVLFVVLRLINNYGDPVPTEHYASFSQTLIAFLNPTKYPPSLMYLLMTLGASFLFLANSENLTGRIVNFFKTFGKVPFFYYVLHIYVIHILAMMLAEYSGFGWQSFILPSWVSETTYLKGYGVGLFTVYLIWIAVIALIYPLCKIFADYKMKNKEKNWLSYL